MPSWDPALYLRFDDHRYRPSLDLVGRLDGEDPRRVWDLGCGTGDLTALLARRWPGAHVTGLDSSAAMLEQARRHDGPDWILGDAATWDPGEPVDLIFSTAALHWVGDHERLFPRLLSFLSPGGVLAVQMPRNFDQPSHTLLHEVAGESRWAERLAHLITPPPVAEPSWYHDLLRPLTGSLDIWETVYLQALTGEDPVATWTRGTAARPYLDALDPTEGEAFFAEYAARIRIAYPASPDGVTLFPFRRLFVVARG